MAAQSGQRIAPLFSAAPGTSEKVSINLDDIFADCFFSQDGGSDVNVLGGEISQSLGGPVKMEQQQEKKNTAHVSGPLTTHYPHGPPGLPLASMEEDDYGMGMSGDDSAYSDQIRGGNKRETTNLIGQQEQQQQQQQNKSTKRSRTSAREMTEQQKDERRERNREHAKRSRVRKKFLLESLQQSVNALQYENDKLRIAIRDKVGDDVANDLLAKVSTCSNVTQIDMNEQNKSLIAKSPSDATRILDDPDYSLVKALQTAQQNFVITDPSLPDNPIVFASQGFLSLTGYSLDNVLGRNCRFLQGPRTDPRAVAKIRKAVEEGYDTSVCLLNYRIDGSTFYNQFFVAPLRDGDGNVVNYVGVQCQVSDAFAQAIARDEQLL